MTDVFKAVVNLLNGLAQSFTAVFDVFRGILNGSTYCIMCVLHFVRTTGELISISSSLLIGAIVDIILYIADCLTDILSIVYASLRLFGKLGTLILNSASLAFHCLKTLTAYFLTCLDFLSLKLGECIILSGYFVDLVVTWLTKIISDAGSIFIFYVHHLLMTFSGFVYDSLLDFSGLACNKTLDVYNSVPELVNKIHGTSLVAIRGLVPKTTLSEILSQFQITDIPFEHLYAYATLSTLSIITLFILSINMLIIYFGKNGISMTIPYLPNVRRRRHEHNMYSDDEPDWGNSDEELSIEESISSDDGESDVEEESEIDYEQIESVELEEYEVASSTDSETDEESDEDVPINIILPQANGRYNLRNRATPTPSTCPKLSASELVNILEDERDKKTCVVCQDQTKTVLVLPCKHLCLCVPCAHAIATQKLAHRRICPLCREKIETVMDVYV